MDEEFCESCDGTGEGEGPDSICRYCRGSGVERRDNGGERDD